MNTNLRRFPVLLVAVLGVALSAHAAFKCQGADGKIEYSDRACDTNKNTVKKPNTNKGVQSRPIGNPKEQLEKLFADFEPRLCEREKLSAGIDAASRSGDMTKTPAVWRPKQERLLELNDVMVDFQTRAGKITKAAGNDSPETAALRKFQAGLRNCDAKAAPAKADSTAPVATSPAAPAKSATPPTPTPKPTPAASK